MERFPPSRKKSSGDTQHGREHPPEKAAEGPQASCPGKGNQQRPHSSAEQKGRSKQRQAHPFFREGAAFFLPLGSPSQRPSRPESGQAPQGAVGNKQKCSHSPAQGRNRHFPKRKEHRQKQCGNLYQGQTEQRRGAEAPHQAEGPQGRRRSSGQAFRVFAHRTADPRHMPGMA